MNTRNIKDAFIQMLKQKQWDTWITITFRSTTTDEYAKKKIKRFFKLLNTKDEKFFDKYIHMWAFYERNRYKDGFHVHILTAGIYDSKILDLEKRCFGDFGNTLIKPVHDGVYEYLASKYVNDDDLEYDFMKIHSKCW